MSASSLWSCHIMRRCRQEDGFLNVQSAQPTKDITVGLADPTASGDADKTYTHVLAQSR